MFEETKKPEVSRLKEMQRLQAEITASETTLLNTSGKME